MKGRCFLKNQKIIEKISQGMYVLTTNGGGCIVDAVSQVSGGDNPLVAVAVMKKNNTNTLMKNNKIFAISVLGNNANPEIIKTFGFYSMRDMNKFEKIETTEINEVKIINDSLGYMICEIVDSIENETHTLFIGRIIDGDLYKDEKEMTYNYYREHKDELLKVNTNNGKTAWICTICGYIYYGDELPEDYKCPVCGVGKELFKKQ